MNRREKEQSIKLELMESIAVSHKALARMLSCAADVTERTGMSSVHLQEYLRVIARCQLSLVRRLTGIPFPAVRRGTPGKVWLNRRIHRVGDGLGPSKAKGT
jgi:hypothetical protein